MWWLRRVPPSASHWRVRSLAETTGISRSTVAREFAADVLADIDTPQAIEYLKTLSHDPNRLVVMSAKSGLAQVKQGPVARAVDEQAVPAEPSGHASVNFR